jgi:hypothetical protein
MTGSGALESSVTLDAVFTVIGTKRVPLAPELAGYLVLEIAEHADPTGGDVDPRSVFIGEEGTVALVKPKREGASGNAEASIRAILHRLLDASGSLTPSLAASSKRKSGAGLPALAEELETALIPVNRAAGRRALARLAREVKRVTLGVGRNALPSSSDAAPSSRRASAPSYTAAGETASSRTSAPTFSPEEDPTTARGQTPEALLKEATPAEWSEMPTTQFEPSRTPSPSQADVDALIDQFAVSGIGEQQHARELKAMAGLEPTPPPPQDPLRRWSVRESASEDSDTEVESLLREGAKHTPPTKTGSARSSAPSVARAAAPETARKVDERQLPTQPTHLHRSRASLASAPRMKPKRGPAILLATASIAVAAGGYAVWELRPGARPGGAPGHSPAPAAAGQTSVPSTAPCKGTLVVHDVPAHAEVLLREGQAPVDVEKMPVGTRLEFVATAEGYAPRRVVVPAGASWDTGPDGRPRLEVAVQLDKSNARAGATDPWPAGEPGSEVGGRGPPGIVRVIATPRGAEVWMLAGIGPDARIEQLRCDRDLEVLVAGPTTFRKRLRVAASDFLADDTPESTSSSPGTKVPTRLAKISTK